jgi:hypothetical protein
VLITHLLDDAVGSGGALVFEWMAMIALFADGLANVAAPRRPPPQGRDPAVTRVGAAAAPAGPGA